jgi:hypothetical protein
MVVFRFSLAMLKRNEDTILALDFEPLLEFLKVLFHRKRLMAEWFV